MISHIDQKTQNVLRRDVLRIIKADVLRIENIGENIAQSTENNANNGNASIILRIKLLMPRGPRETEDLVQQFIMPPLIDGENVIQIRFEPSGKLKMPLNVD